ncbi:MAG: LysE family translocator [Devosia sp.]|jgi:threonine/homoserine/homoserine lactone efflux protein|uniref:LysE family translocator n=1 Tax=Devosia sp. TaxID=1871048 RepID=UPI001A5CAE84|nr:LysE family translocator [Devosia sp.]MBL8598400.1 LysE family translocator [Devosia sp.]
MSYAQSLWIYTVLLFGIVVVPGMDMLFAVTNALTGGRRAGMAAVGGLMLGGAFHAVIAAFAVGVLLSLAPHAFTWLLLVASAYMAWIGFTLMRSSIVIDAVPDAERRRLWVIFSQGTITCLLNPKAYLFTLSVYPQFLRPIYGPLWAQALVMGTLGVLMQLLIYGGMALAASQVRSFLLDSPAVTIWIGRIAGLLFVAVALVSAWHAWTGLAIASPSPVS